jgi:hypothetical protein
MIVIIFCFSLFFPKIQPSEATLSQTSELDGLRLSPHFTLGELTKTSYDTLDIRCYGPEQMIRMAGTLLDIADGTKQEFDELILEKRGSTYWIHFAVRPSSNRRKILFDCR